MARNINDMNSNSLIMQWNRDINGNPISILIQNEEQQVSVTHNLIQLAQIPDQYYRVDIKIKMEDGITVPLIEIYDERDLGDMTFVVDYGTGLVYFGNALAGKTVVAEYYGRGVILISDKRVFHTTGEGFVTTLDEVLEGGKDALALLEHTGGLAGAIELLDQKANKGNAVADRLEDFITETEFYGYTVVLSREAFVVKSSEEGDVEYEEIGSVTSDVVVYKGAKQITPILSIESQTNCTFEVDGQKVFLRTIAKDCIKAQATIGINCGDGLIAYRVLEVTKVFDGINPFQVEISNPFFSFDADANGRIREIQSVTCNFKVTKANEEYRGYTVIIDNLPEGLYCNAIGENEDLQSATFTATLGTALPSNGVVTINFKMNGDITISKSFAYGKSKQGVTAQFLSLVGQQILKYNTPDYSDIPTPSRNVITAVTSGLSGTPVWKVGDGVTWTELPYSSTEISFYHNDIVIWGDKTETTIRCELDGMVDELTLFKIARGAEGYTVMLTNESSIVQINNDSTVPQTEIEKQKTSIVVYRGDKVLIPDSIYVPESGLYSVTITGSQIQLRAISNSIDTIVIPITIVVGDKVFEKEWTIAKAKQGVSGEAGSVYILNVEGGTRSVVYNQLNTNPRPSTSLAFSAKLYKNGEDVTASVSTWIWKAEGVFSGNSAVSTFTPIISDVYYEENLNNTVSVEAICDGNRISYIIPIVVTQDVSGLDWVKDWDDRKVSIRDTEVLTPKLFAGSYNEDIDSITGVAIGTDVLNDGQTTGIVAYQNNKVSFLLDTDGSLVVGNPYDEDGAGLVYSEGNFMLNVKNLSIAGVAVPTWDEMLSTVENNGSNIVSSLQANISAMNQNLNELSSYVDTSLQDNIITEIEKVELDALFEAITQEVLTIQSQYHVIINNQFLTDMEQVESLKTYYTNYMLAYDEMAVLYDGIFGDKEVEEIESVPWEDEYLMVEDFVLENVEQLDVNETLSEEFLEEQVEVVESSATLNTEVADSGSVLAKFKDHLNILKSCSELLCTAISRALISISENQATFMVEQAKEEVRAEIADVDTALLNLENTMNGDFRVGIIKLQNKAILEERLKQLDIEKKDIDGQYEVLIDNASLPIENKDSLTLVKTELDTTHDLLVKKINQAILDNLMTSKELEDINNLIGEYASCLQRYSVVAQECNVTIAENTAKLIVEQSLTDEEIFNKVTNYGEIQGLFIKDKKVYINSEYINTRNFKAVTDDGRETFKIDENGEVHISASSLSITGQSNLATQDYVNSRIESVTNSNVTFTLSNEFQVIPTDEAYYPLSEQTFILDVKGYLGSAEEIKDFIIGTIKSSLGIVAVVSNVNKTVTVTVSPSTPLGGVSGYLDIPITYGDREYNKRWSWAVSRQGNQATYVAITGEQFFKYSNNYTGTPTPSSITLTANTFNTSNNGKWQYFNESNNTWIDWSKNGSVVTDKKLTITPTDATLPTLMRVLVRYYVDSVFDTYTVASISDGYNGKDGIDGQYAHFYIRYSENADGYPMTLEPQENTKYMGVCSTSKDVAPSSYLSYTWSLIKGQDGIIGKDGSSSYLHIKYSNDGVTFTENNGEVVGSYIGTYVDFEEADSTVFSDYNWKKFVGEDGVSIVSIEEKYYLSSSQNSLVDGAWLDTAPRWEIGKYVWTKTIFTYSNGIIKQTNPICISGKDGEEGASVLSVDVLYYQSNSATSLTGGSWVTQAPTWRNGKYVWTKTVTELTNGRTKETNPICITGEKGSSGVGAKSIKIIGSSQIFKSNDGGATYTPETITLTTVTQNVEYGNWKYSVDGGESWSNVVNGQNGLTISNKNLIISKDTDLFTSDMTSIVFRLNSNSSTVYDTMTISKIKDVENLHVGVANLYKQTKVINPSDWNYINEWVIEDEKYKGFTVLSRTGAWMGVYQDGIELLSGERYTLSAYVQGDGVATLYASVQNAEINYYSGFNQNEIAPTDWVRVSFTFTPTENGTTNSVTPRFENSVENCSLKICALKLEKGSLATDWSPNTDDLENAYTIILTNEAQVIPTNSEGKPLQSETYETQIQVYQGTSPRTDFIIDNISSKDGITVEQTNNTVKFYVNPSNTIPNSGNFNISITIDEKTFNKVFSWSCSKSGKDGESNYTILLSNENHTFTSNYLGVAVEQTTYTDIIAYKGTTLVDPTIGKLPTVEGLTLSSSGNRVTIKANYGTTLADNGSFDIPIILDDKEFVKSFSWSKVKDGSIGANGKDGANAKNVNIVASNMVFKSTDGGTTFTPNTIKLTAQYQNLTHSRWQYSINGGTTWMNVYNGGWQGGITATSDSLTITIPKTCPFFTDTTTSVVFKAISTDESFYDVITITKLYDVADVDFEGIAEDIAQDKVNALDNRLNQQAIFNRLTNNGKSQGMYLENGQLYINGEYIEANTIRVDQLEIGSITTFVENKVQTGIDNTNIGARNYLANTGTPFTMTGDNTTNQTSTMYHFVNKDNSPIIGGEATITFKYEIAEGSTGSIRVQTNGQKSGSATTGNWFNIYRVDDITTIDNQGEVTYTRAYNESELHTFNGISLRLDNFVGSITISECSMVVGNKSVGWTPAPEDTSDEIQDKINKLDKSLTQSNIFNRLTNNGAMQGLFMENGALYVNGEYINSKNFKATDNNGNQTFLIDSNGNVSINAKSLTLSGQGVTTQDEVLKLISEYNENENLVIEPNFNNGLGNWSLSSSTNIMIDTTYTHNGNKAIRFKYTGTKSCSMWTDSFSVTEITQGNTYTAKMYCYVEKNSSISGNIKYSIYGKPTGGTSSVLISEAVLTSTNFANGRWVEITFDFTPSQTYTSPRLHINSSSSATIWFCDFALSITKVGYTQKQLVDVLNGVGDGLYIVDGKLLVNSEYINARGLSVTNNNGVKTFEIDNNGNVKIVADSFSVSTGGSGNVVTKDELQESIDNTKEYVDSTINASSAVNILMSNPVQVIATNVSCYPLSSTTYTTTLQVFQGVKEITNYTIGKISNAHGMTVTQTNNSISFTVNKTTKISESGSFNINVTVNGVTYKQKFSFTTARQGEAGSAGSSCSVNITATSNIFKSGDGGLTFSPDTITLTPILQNLTYSAWQYSVDGGTTWNGFTSSITGWSVSNKVLTISKSCSLFTDTVTSIAIKVVTTDDAYYDIVTIIRLYDTAQLEVGGTNLIPDSTNDLETWASVTSGYLGHNAILLERSTTGNTSRTFRTKYITDEVSVKTGETYTLSAMVYVDSKITLNKTNNNIYMRLNFDNGNYKDFCVCQLPTTIQKDTWIKVSKTEKLDFSSNVDSIVLQIALQDAGSIKTSMIQLERGNVATDWKPSPKDSFNAKEVNSLISQTRESIEMSVSSTYTTQKAFDALSVGGRNFAQNTSSDWVGVAFKDVTPTNYPIYNKNVLIVGEVGDVLTYRLELRLTGMEVASGQTNGTVRLQGSGDVTSWSSGSFYGKSYTIQPGDSNIVITGTITLNENHLKNSYWKTSLRFDNVVSGTVEVRNYMFEKGTLNSSWSPAPEDVLNSISTAKKDAVSEAVAQSATNVDSRLNSYSTTTDVKAMFGISENSIISNVSKTYETKANATKKYNGFTSSINSLSTRMNSAEQKITSDAIINTVSGTYVKQTDFDNMTIGGRNLIVNSNFYNGFTNWNGNTDKFSLTDDNVLVYNQTGISKPQNYQLYTDAIDVSGYANKDLILTFEYNISNTSLNTTPIIGCIMFFEDDTSTELSQAVSFRYLTYTDDYVSGTRAKHTSVIAPSKEAKFVRIYALMSQNGKAYWTNFQLEVGNKATDWSPAPEDTIDSISSLETRVSTAEQKITKDAIISTVSSTYVKKTDFDNMTIGGENLIVNSNFEYGFEKWKGSTNIFYLTENNVLGYNQLDLTEQKNYQIATEPIDVSSLVGKELTLSFDYNITDKSQQTNTTIGYIRFFNSEHKDSTAQADSIAYTNCYYPSDYVNGSRRTAKKTVTVPTGATYVRIGAYQAQNGNIYYTKFQLEVGNKATAWKPSLQDAYLYADQTTSSINDELQDLTSIVSLNNGSDALTPQLKVKLVAEYKDAKSLYDNLSDMYKKVGITDFAHLVTAMNNAHTNLQTAITNMEKSINTTNEGGLSAVLSKFNAFYESADTLNQAIINGLKGVTDGLSTSIEQLSKEVNIQIGSFNTQLGQITTRFTFGTDGLTIKSTQNATKYIKLDNDSLDFMDNGAKVADITNQQLNISRATITNEMKIGNVKIKPSGIGGVMFVFE